MINVSNSPNLWPFIPSHCIYDYDNMIKLISSITPRGWKWLYLKSWIPKCHSDHDFAFFLLFLCITPTIFKGFHLTAVSGSFSPSTLAYSWTHYSVIAWDLRIFQFSLSHLFTINPAPKEFNPTLLLFVHLGFSWVTLLQTLWRFHQIKYCICSQMQ